MPVARYVVATLVVAGCGRLSFEQLAGDVDANGDGGGSADASIDADPSCVNGWCPEAAPPGVTANLWSVWALAPDNVWAVGRSGTILHRDANGWVQKQSNTTADLYGVWAATADKAWAVGSGGTIVLWDGNLWAEVTSGTTQLLFEVFGFGTANAFAVGDGGTVRRWNGANWITESGGGVVMGPLDAVWGSSLNDLWISSTGEYVFHFSAGGWMQEMPTGDVDYFDVWGTGPNDVWAMGYENAHWTGAGWTPVTSTATYVVDEVWGSATDVWGVGFEGTVVHYAGTQFDPVDAGVGTTTLNGIHGVGTTMWAVGDGATIIRRDSLQ
jgi:hypothetical protein